MNHIAIIRFNHPVCHATAQKVSPQVSNAKKAAPGFVSWWHHQEWLCVSNPDWTVQDNGFLFLPSVSGWIFHLSTQCNGWPALNPCDIISCDFLRCSDTVIDRLLSRFPRILMGKMCGLRDLGSWPRYWVFMCVWVCSTDVYRCVSRQAGFGKPSS